MAMYADSVRSCITIYDDVQWVYVWYTGYDSRFGFELKGAYMLLFFFVSFLFSLRSFSDLDRNYWYPLFYVIISYSQFYCRIQLLLQRLLLLLLFCREFQLLTK